MFKNNYDTRFYHNRHVFHLYIGFGILGLIPENAICSTCRND